MSEATLFTLQFIVNAAASDGIYLDWRCRRKGRFIISHPGSSTSVVSGVITVNSEPFDDDEDGYTDLQEYLNEVAEETDPLGNDYDPKVENAP